MRPSKLGNNEIVHFWTSFMHGYIIPQNPIKAKTPKGLVLISDTDDKSVFLVT